MPESTRWLRWPGCGLVGAVALVVMGSQATVGSQTAVAADSPAGLPAGSIAAKKGADHWAFVRPRSQSLPVARDAGWSRSRMDRFVLARLEGAKHHPAAEAERAVLLRRATFDLTGLPPSPDDLAEFLADPSPDAWERAVDRLLASPAYGERWARAWLDLARYAEDQAHIVGDDRSLCYPNAYLYRDWIIRALNGDLPYDQFVRLQLAADLIEPQETRNLPALGFLGLGPKYYDRGQTAVMASEWEDRVDVVTRGLLGLTVACARCHDHKFDPIATQDYYALAGVFASTEMYNRPLDDRREKKNGQAKQPTDAMHVVREGKPANLRVFIRGDANNKGEEVARRFLPVLSGGKPQPFQQGSGRRELADVIAARDNPLTARVFVNRVWAALFGRGLVTSPSNWGVLADPPSHPELLDDLAIRWSEAGWSVKSLQRELVTSATYRQSSRGEKSLVESDPENALFGRVPRRRLPVEAWRDAILSAGGTLEARVGGPSINPLDVAARRRTVYSEISRLDLNRLLAAFDFPDANLHADRRVETTTPLQKLYVLNSPWFIDQAGKLAARLVRDIPGGAPNDERRRIEHAYAILYHRPPAADELQLGLAYLGNHAAARWPSYAQVLLAANEMMFID